MISKIGALLTVAIAALFLAAPTNVHAATSSSDKKKIAALKKQLNALPNKAASVSQIDKILKQLTKLDPKNGANYLNTGLKKLAPPNAANNAKKLEKNVVNLVNKSKLTSSQKKSVTKKAEKVLKSYKPPKPTPTPYQAMLLGSEVAA